MIFKEIEKNKDFKRIENYKMKLIINRWTPK